MTHTYTFFDGFEQQADALTESRAQAIVGTIGVETTITSYSRAAMRLNLAAAAASFNYKLAGLATNAVWGTASQDYNWYSFHLYITTLPGAGLFMWLARSGIVNPHYLRLTETGALSISVGGAYEASAGVLTAGQWYVVSFQHYKSSTLRVIARNRDTGATVVDKTHSAASDVGPPADVLLGAYTTSTGNVVIDNFAMECSNTAGDIDDPANDLTTKYAVGALLPDGTGSYDVWTNDYTKVREAPSDGDATYRQAAASGAFTQTLAATSGLAAQVGTIKAAIGWALWRSTGGQTGTANIRMRSSATDVNTAGNGAIPVTYIAAQLLRTTDPATSSAWTVSGIDSAEMGAADAGNNTIRVTTCGIDILYIVTTYERIKRVEYVMDEADERQRIFNPNGRAIGLCELEPNAWMRSMSETHLRLDVVDDFQDQEDMAYLEGVRYSETAEGVQKATPQGSPEDFVRTLLTRVAMEAGDV